MAFRRVRRPHYCIMYSPLSHTSVSSRGLQAVVSVSGLNAHTVWFLQLAVGDAGREEHKHKAGDRHTEHEQNRVARGKDLHGVHVLSLPLYPSRPLVATIRTSAIAP